MHQMKRPKKERKSRIDFIKELPATSRKPETRDAIIKSIAGGLMSSVQLDLRDLRKGLLQPQTRQRKPEQKKAVARRRGTKSYGSRSQSII
ncbi:hypothetical protein FOYG_09327 [Fusarium oxysporum NRRL 32931]|uniref:Uncharacterized protein n=1 Tax=Fusarium oxysporum NRRL 32931 TaxID=660029 RepID=W9I3Y8_FUSOX|nr:hypothetical protein FOYG_09327 [Fusarium oxysporum NRRL 32931]